MLVALAAASLLRHRARTVLAIVGVAVSSAMLLDMVMLSTGMRESFRSLLITQGFQLRLTPKGTLPFDSDASIRGADSVVALIRARSAVRAVSPVLGGQLHVVTAARVVTASVLGVEAAVQGDYQLVSGRAPHDADVIVANDARLRDMVGAVGD